VDQAVVCAQLCRQSRGAHPLASGNAG
jgi:hypothetical protein